MLSMSSLLLITSFFSFWQIPDSHTVSSFWVSPRTTHSHRGVKTHHGYPAQPQEDKIPPKPPELLSAQPLLLPPA